MILDRIAPHAADSNQSGSANDLSRRRLLQAAAATGGGLMLSMSLPFANGAAEAADAGGFAPNAFIRIDSDGQIVLTMPYVEMGQGDYTAIPMLIAEELEVEPEASSAGACSAQRKAVRESLARRGAGDGRLDCDERGLATDA